MTPGEAAPHVLEALRGGPPVAEVVVVSGADAGRRMLVWEDRTLGTLGSSELDARAAEIGRRALSEGGPRLETVAAPETERTLYADPHRAPGELVIVGAGHIARPLCALGALLGYTVTVLDDRPGFATRERFPEAERVLQVDFQDPFSAIELGGGSHLVLVTRGHKYDFEALRDVLNRSVRPAYIGMVGSQRRVRAALEQLAREGVDADRLRQVHAPIGVDIGAETPEEIAISIAAELVRVRRGGTGASLRDRARVVDRWIEKPGAVRTEPSFHPSEPFGIVDRLIPVERPEDIPGAYRGSPIGKLLEYHNLERPFGSYSQAELLIGMCMDNRKHLHIPDNFAYILRAGGANLRPSEFKVSYAIAVGGIRSIALIGHTQCGMVNLMARKQDFVRGLVEGAGWEPSAAEDHFLHFSPIFEIGSEVDFVLSEAKRLRLRYPRIQVAPMLYRVEDNRLYLLREHGVGGDTAAAGDR